MERHKQPPNYVGGTTTIDPTRYQPLLRRLTRELPNREDAHDLHQDAYARLLHYQREHRVESIPAFLTRTVANLMTDRYRRRQTRGEDRHESIDSEPLLPSDGLNPEQILNRQQYLQLLHRQLQQLDVNHRNALILHRFHEQTYEQIAETMGVSVRTIQNYISRAMAELAATMRPYL